LQRNKYFESPNFSDMGFLRRLWRKKPKAERRIGAERRKSQLFEKGVGATGLVSRKDFAGLNEPKPKVYSPGRTTKDLIVRDRRLTPSGPFGETRPNPDRRKPAEEKK
jgi:hypothetical protein